MIYSYLEDEPHWLVRNASIRIYLMWFFLKDVVNNIMDHKSLSSKSLTLHGRATVIKVIHFEKARLQVSKMKSDQVFVKRCRDSSIITGFANIKHHHKNPRNIHIFLVASLGLIHYEIVQVRKNLDLVSRKLLALHLELSNLFSVDLWGRIDACSIINDFHLEIIWKKKKSSKFLRLSNSSDLRKSSVPYSNLTGNSPVFSNIRIGRDHISSLNVWVSNLTLPFEANWST